MKPINSIPKPCVILTATVKVGDISFTTRTDPAVRLADYKYALSKWLADSSIDALVFIENSGFDLSELQEICGSHKTKHVELISFKCADFDGRLGKGYGEILCLEHALQESQLLQRSHQFLKTSGRYYLRNARPLLDFLSQNPQLEIMCDLKKNLTWADSRAFGGRVEFLRHYLIPLRESINDSADVFFEHALARATHRAMADARPWAMPPQSLDIEGVSATSNASYRVNPLRVFARRMLHQIKLTLEARC